eukprot:3161262-Amphidinium_carterae.1
MPSRREIQQRFTPPQRYKPRAMGTPLESVVKCHSEEMKALAAKCHKQHTSKWSLQLRKGFKDAVQEVKLLQTL